MARADLASVYGRLEAVPVEEDGEFVFDVDAFETEFDHETVVTEAAAVRDRIESHGADGSVRERDALAIAGELAELLARQRLYLHQALAAGLVFEKRFARAEFGPAVGRCRPGRPVVPSEARLERRTCRRAAGAAGGPGALHRGVQPGVDTRRADGPGGGDTLGEGGLLGARAGRRRVRRLRRSERRDGTRAVRGDGPAGRPHAGPLRGGRSGPRPDRGPGDDGSATWRRLSTGYGVPFRLTSRDATDSRTPSRTSTPATGQGGPTSRERRLRRWTGRPRGAWKRVASRTVRDRGRERRGDRQDATRRCTPR